MIGSESQSFVVPGNIDFIHNVCKLFELPRIVGYSQDIFWSSDCVLISVSFARSCLRHAMVQDRKSMFVTGLSRAIWKALKVLQVSIRPSVSSRQPGQHPEKHGHNQDDQSTYEQSDLQNSIKCLNHSTGTVIFSDEKIGVSPAIGPLGKCGRILSFIDAAPCHVWESIFRECVEPAFDRSMSSSNASCQICSYPFERWSITWSSNA